LSPGDAAKQKTHNGCNSNGNEKNPTTPILTGRQEKVAIELILLTITRVMLPEFGGLPQFLIHLPA
jgi:hypothetical protein